MVELGDIAIMILRLVIYTVINFNFNFCKVLVGIILYYTKIIVEMHL